MQIANWEKTRKKERKVNKIAGYVICRKKYMEFWEFGMKKEGRDKREMNSCQKKIILFIFVTVTLPKANSGMLRFSSPLGDP